MKLTEGATAARKNFTIPNTLPGYVKGVRGHGILD